MESVCVLQLRQCRVVESFAQPLDIVRQRRDLSLAAAPQNRQPRPVRMLAPELKQRRRSLVVAASGQVQEVCTARDSRQPMIATAETDVARGAAERVED